MILLSFDFSLASFAAGLGGEPVLARVAVASVAGRE
jgi:hypothetical protein